MNDNKGWGYNENLAAKARTILCETTNSTLRHHMLVIMYFVWLHILKQPMWALIRGHDDALKYIALFHSNCKIDYNFNSL